VKEHLEELRAKGVEVKADENIYYLFSLHDLNSDG